MINKKSSLLTITKHDLTWLLHPDSNLLSIPSGLINIPSYRYIYQSLVILQWFSRG